MSESHLNSDGVFVSDKYVVHRFDPVTYAGNEVTPGSFVLRFSDPIARQAIKVYATLVEPVDPVLSADLLEALEIAESS